MKRTLTFTSLLFTVAMHAQTPAYDWSFQLGHAANLSRNGKCIAVDNTGNTWSAGTFEGTIDLDPGAGTYLLTSAGNKDIYVAKYSPAGNVLAGFSISAGGEDICSDLAVDDSGNVVITGRFFGTADFDPGAGTHLLTSNTFPGSFDAFVAKYDANGNLRWAFNLGNTLYITCEGSAIATDVNGNVYVTGAVYAGGVDFDPDTNSTSYVTGNPQTCFLAKYTPQGALVFAFGFAGMGNTTSGNAIAVSDNGKILLSGRLHGTVSMDPLGTSGLVLYGNASCFVAQYDTNGLVEWAFVLPNYTLPNQSTLVTLVNDVTFDRQHNVLVTGSFPIAIDADPGAGAGMLTAADSSYDFFVAKYDANGHYLWGASAGGAGRDWGNSVVTDANSNIYITGGFSDTVDFDPGTGVHNLVCASLYSDVFALRYSPNGIFHWAFSIGNTQYVDEGNAIAVNGRMIYLTGCFRGTADFDPSGATQNMASFGGVQDAFIASYMQDSTVSVPGVAAVRSFVVFPVPASGLLNIQMSAAALYTLEVTDACGSCVLRQQRSSDAFAIDLHQQPEGMYMLVLTNTETGARYTKPVVIAR